MQTLRLWWLQWYSGSQRPQQMRYWVLLIMAGGCLGLTMGQQPTSRAGQAQVANQFLRAVLRGQYAAAYRRLAPEVRQGVSYAQFAAAARPLHKTGQQHGVAIELYKLGVRLGDRNASRLFYDFSFAADSSLRSPSMLLEVTFRDTATRAVLGFSLRHMHPPRPKTNPAHPAK